MPEWSKGAACKAVIRGFKSRSALHCRQIRSFGSAVIELASSHIAVELSNERGKWVRVPLFSPLRVRPGNPGPLAQLARALPRHGRGHWFESSTAHVTKKGSSLFFRQVALTVDKSVETVGGRLGLLRIEEIHEVCPHRLDMFTRRLSNCCLTFLCDDGESAPTI